MKTLIHIRHSIRSGGHDHINSSGIELARKVGSTLGAFDYVLTSNIQRAIETAVAAGFAVNETSRVLAQMPSEVQTDVIWNGGFGAWSKAFDKKNMAFDFALKVRAEIDNVLEKIKEGGRLLVVTHGGIVESGAVSQLEGVDFSSWGEEVSFCEGYTANYENGVFSEGQLLRKESEI